MAVVKYIQKVFSSKINQKHQAGCFYARQKYYVFRFFRVVSNEQRIQCDSWAEHSMPSNSHMKISIVFVNYIDVDLFRMLYIINKSLNH